MPFKAALAKRPEFRTQALADAYDAGVRAFIKRPHIRPPQFGAGKQGFDDAQALYLQEMAARNPTTPKP